MRHAASRGAFCLTALPAPFPTDFPAAVVRLPSFFRVARICSVRSPLYGNIPRVFPTRTPSLPYKTERFSGQKTTLPRKGNGQGCDERNFSRSRKRIKEKRAVGKRFRLSPNDCLTAIERKSATCFVGNGLRLTAFDCLTAMVFFVGAAHTRKGHCPLTHIAQAYGLLMGGNELRLSALTATR